MNHIQKFQNFTEFEDGSVKAVYHGGGSYDRYIVYSDGKVAADLSVNHRDTPKGTVWTWHFSDEESPLALEVRKAFEGRMA